MLPGHADAAVPGRARGAGWYPSPSTGPTAQGMLVCMQTPGCTLPLVVLFTGSGVESRNLLENSAGSRMERKDFEKGGE